MTLKKEKLVYITDGWRRRRENNEPHLSTCDLLPVASWELITHVLFDCCQSRVPEDDSPVAGATRGLNISIWREDTCGELLLPPRWNKTQSENNATRNTMGHFSKAK